MSLPHDSRKSIAAYYQRNEAAAAADQPDPNPDGVYWQRGVRANQDILSDLIGKELYEQWANLVWPDDDQMDKLTWAGMYRQLANAVTEALMGQRDVNALANAAKYRDESVPGSYGL